MRLVFACARTAPVCISQTETERKRAVFREYDT